MTRVAAIDCGTNSIRLLISDIDEVQRSAKDVFRTMQTVRLGEGMDRHRTFTDAALERTFTAAAEYAAAIENADVDAVRFVATSASRDARNRDEFIAGIVKTVGVEPEVISGDEEAALTFRGALMTHGLRVGEASTLVVDIGGGSTEFVRGNMTAGMIAARSVDIGCVRLTERHLHSDPPTPSQIQAAMTDIDEAIEVANATVDLRSADILIGVAGSVTTVSAIALGLDEYDAELIDGSVISRRAVADVTASLLGMTRRERAGLAVMHSGRVDVIGGGTLILDRIAEFVGADQVLVSEHDILDGIAWSVVEEQESA